MHFTEVMDWVSRGFEVAGVVVLIAGFVSGAWRSAALWRRARESSYQVVRRSFGRSILLGLEILVAADLIRTVAVDQTWQNVLTLGVIVLIRTFLSLSLIHISEPTRLLSTSYAVFCLTNKNKHHHHHPSHLQHLPY